MGGELSLLVRASSGFVSLRASAMPGRPAVERADLVLTRRSPKRAASTAIRVMLRSVWPSCVVLTAVWYSDCSASSPGRQLAADRGPEPERIGWRNTRVAAAAGMTGRPMGCLIPRRTSQMLIG